MLSKNTGVRVRGPAYRHIVVKLLNHTNKAYRSNKKKSLNYKKNQTGI